jgi:diguanylate cyclase (GGDEF)-like protein
MKVLFAAANPMDTSHIALDEEIRLITQKVAGSPYGSAIEFITAWAARPDDLLQAVNEHSPDVLHFAGHGTSRGIALVGDDRRTSPVSYRAVAKLTALGAARSLKIVLLNSCYSAGLALEVRDLVGCAIGTVGSWGDRQASLFAASFYRALGFGTSIQEAVEQGCTSIVLEGFEGADDVRMHSRDGFADRPLLGPGRKDTTQCARHRGPGVPGEQSIPPLDESECAARVADHLFDPPCSLTYIDIDGLLGINTVYGEHVGDAVIDTCGALIAASLPAGADVSRLRGDQFVIVHRGQEPESAEKTATAVVRKLRKHDWTRIALNMFVTATGAIAHWRDGEDATSLILRAVLGVKEAKQRQKSALVAAPFALPEIKYRGSPEDEERHRIRQLAELLSAPLSRERTERIGRQIQFERGRPRF